MTDKELLDKAIYWFKVIAEDMERITSGNLPHNAAITKGRAIRAYEFLEKHRQEEPVSKELEDAAEGYGIRQGVELKPFAIKFFKAGAKWQKEQDQSTIELAEDHAMLAGMNKMEEQMLAKAVDVTVTGIREYKEENEVDFTLMLEKGTIPYELEEDIKVILIKKN